MNFEKLNIYLDSVKKNKVIDKSKCVYLLTAFSGRYDLDQLNFDLIDLDDVINLQNDIYDFTVYLEDEEEEIMNPSHDYTKLLAIQEVIHQLIIIEKKLLPSTYRFL